MVLAAALHQSRHDTRDDFIIYRNDQDSEGVYLFASEFPDYDRRMEVIAFMARMQMGWESKLTLV